MIYANINTHEDFRNRVNYDYDEVNRCDDSCDPYCRCGVITNARVTSISSNGIAQWLGKTIPSDASDLDKYILERLVKHTFRTDMFRVEACDGYYGQEVGSVKINTSSSGYADFARKIEVFNRLTSTRQQVQMILTLEYGYLLPEISAVEEWAVLELATKKVHVDEKVLSRVSKEVVARYVHTEPSHGIRGVVVPQGNAFRLVDGFHRYSAWTSNQGRSRKKKPQTRGKIRVVGPRQ